MFTHQQLAVNAFSMSSAVFRLSVRWLGSHHRQRLFWNKESFVATSVIKRIYPCVYQSVGEFRYYEAEEAKPME
jgi:hypothetical protein